MIRLAAALAPAVMLVLSIVGPAEGGERNIFNESAQIDRSQIEDKTDLAVRSLDWIVAHWEVQP